MTTTPDTGDGIDEALTTTASVALTATRAGVHLARIRAQSKRAAHAQAQQSGQQLAARLAAERQAAGVYFAAVSRPEYLEHASAQDLADAHRQAVVWRDRDPSAAQAEQVLADRFRQRFGTHPASNETATTVALVAGADAADQAARTRQDAAGQQHPDGPAWDSRERRERLATP